MMANATKKAKPCIVTIEANSEKVERARKNFSAAGVNNLIEIIQGPALGVLRKLSKSRKKTSFDFVFIDADKENMIEYFDIVLPMVKVGGIIAADNILHPDRFRPDMIKYANHVRSNPTVQSITVPIGNGEEITLKLRD
jgi:predicted O-methyltransferase YrrM